MSSGMFFSSFWVCRDAFKQKWWQSVMTVWQGSDRKHFLTCWTHRGCPLLSAGIPPSLSVIPTARDVTCHGAAIKVRAFYWAVWGRWRRLLIDSGRKIGCQSTNSTLFKIPSQDAFWSLRRINLTKGLRWHQIACGSTASWECLSLSSNRRVYGWVNLSPGAGPLGPHWGP